MADSPDLLALVRARFTGLSDERASLLRRVAEIDEQLAVAAAALGIDVATITLAPSSQATPPRVDGRRAGTMLEFAHGLLAKAPDGMTREELRDLILASDIFGEALQKNPNNLYNILSRGVARRELATVNGRFYLAAKVPQVVPNAPNVRSLFNPNGGQAAG